MFIVYINVILLNTNNLNVLHQMCNNNISTLQHLLIILLL